MQTETVNITKFVQFAMGTVISHRVFGNSTETILQLVNDTIAEMETRLSCFLRNSEISRINQSAGIKAEPIHPETLSILKQSKEVSECCSGLFDVTVGPLVDLWKIGKDSFHFPMEEEIRKVLSLVNFRDLLLDEKAMTAGLRFPGQSLDLGGIAKGLAGDKIAALYKMSGVVSACSNLGGNVVTVGGKPDGSVWQVGIQHPRSNERLIGSVAVEDLSLVTSGDYQRFTLDQNGNRYHHILSPITGRPTCSELISVSIVSESSLTADALSTVLFIAGIDQGLEILGGFPGTEAVLVDAGEQVFVTGGLEGRFQPAPGISYKIV